jgi:hypothetical protein
MDCYSSGGTINASYSLIETGSDCVNGTSSAILTGDPKLGPLADNGGPTLTHLPLRGSPLIDAVLIFVPNPGDDQRGVPRAQGPYLDIGSVEVQPPLFEDGFESP